MTPKMLAEWMDVPKGKIQRNRQLAVLSAVLTKAVRRWHAIKFNPCRDTERHESKPRTRLIEDHELKGVMALASRRVALAMRLALKTGQRQGDILNMRWSDIKGMELHVFQTKTRKRLAIGIDAELEKILDDCWQLPHGGQEWVLPTKKGSRYTSEGFRACWQRVMKKWMRGGGENFHFHDIRALCATRCPTPEYAMKLLGHQSINMTLRVYRRGVERVQALPTGV